MRDRFTADDGSSTNARGPKCHSVDAHVQFRSLGLLEGTEDHSYCRVRSVTGSGLRDGADCAGRSFEGFWWLVSSLWTLVDHMIFIKAWQDVEFSSWRFSGSAAQSVVMPNGNFEENIQKVPKLQLCNFPGHLLQQSTAS